MLRLLRFRSRPNSLISLRLQSTSTTDPYTILGIERNCSQNEIREAYLFLSRMHHPDNPDNLGKESEAQDKFLKVQEAYKKLYNSSKTMGKDFGDGKNSAIFYDSYTETRIPYHFKTEPISIRDCTFEEHHDMRHAHLSTGPPSVWNDFKQMHSYQKINVVGAGTKLIIKWWMIATLIATIIAPKWVSMKYERFKIWLRVEAEPRPTVTPPPPPIRKKETHSCSTLAPHLPFA